MGNGHRILLDLALALLCARGFLARLRRGALLCPIGATPLLFRLLARARAGRRKLQDRVLEELHQAEHGGRLAGIERLRAYQKFLLVLGVVELGEVFSSGLVQNELDAKLGHANLLWLISI